MTTDAHTEVPGLWLAWILGVMAGFASVLSAGAAVVMPTIAAAINIPTILTVWVISGFSLAYGVSMALYGRVADLYGLRLPLVAGTVLMGAGSLLAAVATTFPVLMVARIAQGIGGAAVPVLGVAIVTSFGDHRLNTRGLALVTGLSSLGAGTGALIGGVLESALSWRYALGVPALNMLLLLAAFRVVPDRGSGAKLDVPGAALVIAMASGIILLAQSASTGRTVAVAGAVLITTSVPMLISWAGNHPHGFLPAAVIRNGQLRRVVFTATAVPVAWFSLLAAVPIAVHSMDWSPIQTGLALAPSGVIGFLSARNAARVVTRIGPIAALRITTVLASCALVISASGAYFELPFMTTLGVYFVTGAFGLQQPAMVTAINQRVDADVRGAAIGIAIMTNFVFGALGAAVIGGFSELVGMAATIASLLLFTTASFAVVQRLIRVA